MQPIVIGLLWLTISGLSACSSSAHSRSDTGKAAMNYEDSAMLAQMHKNIRLADLADQACAAKVKEADRRYVMDILGFWYSKTMHEEFGDSLLTGQEVEIHIQMKTLGGEMLLDSKHPVIVGAGEQIMAVEQVLHMMRKGEEMHIVAPWYLAYGKKGTKIIEPYSNLEIILTVEK